MNDWQPIETAPDDVRVLVWEGYWPRYNVAVHAKGNGVKWFDNYGVIPTPTHWMPLPAPPSEDEAGR